jgi:hypothetical protein
MQENILILEEDLNVFGVLNVLDRLFADVQNVPDRLFADVQQVPDRLFADVQKKVPSKKNTKPSEFFPSIYVSGNFAYVHICLMC